MEDVDKASHTSVLAKCHQPHTTLIKYLLIVHKSDTLMAENEEITYVGCILIRTLEIEVCMQKCRQECLITKLQQIASNLPYMEHGGLTAT